MWPNLSGQNMRSHHAGRMAAGGKLLAGPQYAVRQTDHLLAAGLVQVDAALVEVLQEEAGHVPVHLRLGEAVAALHTLLQRRVDTNMGVQLFHQSTAIKMKILYQFTCTGNQNR
jgi:hypothetical protein